VIGATVRAAGIVTGWGRGVAALPSDARTAANGRAVIEARPTPRPVDRLRRATRECLLALDAVDALLEDGGLTGADLTGDGTALVYVTAAAYGASNRIFVEGGGGALHFPYTAPSAVPAEVAIEFGLHGPYAVLIGGPATTIDALEHARTLLARGACARALVLAVETFAECADLHARARWLVDRPLVEAAAAVLLEPGDAAEDAASVLGPDGSARAGQTLACGPLIAVALGRDAARERLAVAGRWRGRETALTLSVMLAAPRP
jgi:3-oxoacyl-[acyl-carrier-protein] synthase III